MMHTQDAQDMISDQVVVSTDIITMGQKEAFHFREVPKVLLEWKNLSYDVKINPTPAANLAPKERIVFRLKNLFKTVQKTILFSQSGFAKPGTVTAIMGPSGAGKTSLLNILSQRVKATEGEMIVNSVKVGKAFKSISAFVQQDDVLLSNLTVRETLRYAAMLRLGNVSMKERMERVDDLMQELGLSRVADTQVGNPGLVKGISGGERKRLCIAMELLTQPSVLFLDEPTTGLDAKTSLSVINTINKLAQNGRTVILTIHQPRSDIFQSFDRLLLLARGKVAYFGVANKVLPYFSKLGYECPEEFNPADFFMDLVTENPALVEQGKMTKEQENQRIESILSKYSENFDELASAQKDGSNMEHLKRRSKYTASWLSQFLVVLMRSFLNTIRNKGVTMARFFQQVSTAFLLGLIYLRLKGDQTGVQDRLGVLFFSVSNMFFGSLSSSLNVLLSDKPVFNRERGAKMYRVSSFYLAKVIADIPSVLFFPLLFGCILYYWIGLNGGVDRFLMFLLIQAILGLTGQGLGIAIASISPNAAVGYTIMPVISTILMLFGGFYLNVNNVPVYFIWIYWSSIFHFAFEAFCINEFTSSTFECTSSNYCPFPNGAAVLENLAMDSSMSTTWINIGLSCALIVVYHIFAYLCLRFLFKARG